MSEENNGDFPSRKCPICGKLFIIQPFHAYKTHDASKRLLCSWACVVEYDRRKEEKKQPKKDCRKCRFYEEQNSYCEKKRRYTDFLAKCKWHEEKEVKNDEDTCS